MPTRRVTRDGVVCGEVDGVPAYWLPKREGPAAALLLFRVGQADESLPVRGISHLVEHLALVPTGRQPHDYNGQTGTSTTSFGMVGQPQELVRFFDVLGQSLRALPFERLPSERTVLQTEERGRGHASDGLWGIRWGPQGHGLLSYDELGVLHVGEEQLQSWSDRWFVRQNAALVLNGPPPRGLALPLLDGVRASAPVVLPPVDALPTWFPQQPPGFGLSYLRDRSAASGVAAWLLSERMNAVLRHERGLVYGVSSGSTVLTPDVRHDVLWTQALDTQLEAAVEAMLDVLRRRAEPMTAVEKKAWTALKRQQRRQSAAAPGSTGWAVHLAESMLLGDEDVSFEAFDAEARAVKESAVLAQLDALRESLLMALPADTDAGDLAPPIPQSSGDWVDGDGLRPAHGQDWRLVVGDDGVTSVDTDGRHVTVRYDACAAVRAWDDGARQVLGSNGFNLLYRPEQWRDDAAQVAARIDRGVGPDRVVPSGPREPVEPPSGDGPQVWVPPVAGASQPTPGVDRSLLALGVFLAVIGVVGAFAGGAPDSSTADHLSFFLVMEGAAAGLGYRWVHRRWHRRGTRIGVYALLALCLALGVVGLVASASLRSSG